MRLRSGKIPENFFQKPLTNTKNTAIMINCVIIAFSMGILCLFLGFLLIKGSKINKKRRNFLASVGTLVFSMRKKFAIFLHL